MIATAFFGVLLALAMLSLTAKRVFVICGFYCFYAFLTIWDKDSVPHVGPVTIYRALYVIIVISLFTRWIKDPDLPAQMRRWPLSSYGFLIILLLASSLYSQASQPFSAGSGDLWGRLVVMSLFWMAAFHVHHEDDFKIFAWTTVVIALVLSFWVVWSAAHLQFQVYRAGVEADQNYVSTFVMIGTLLLLNFFFVGRKRWIRLGSLLLVFCMLFTCVLLASRGMFVAFAVAATALAISSLRHHRRRLIFAGAGLVAALGIALLLPGGEGLWARFNQGDLNTLNERTLVWSYSLRYFGDSSLPRMIFGQGLGSDPPIISPVVPDLGNYHNDYLRWLMDRGMVGLAAFLVFLNSIRRKIAESSHPLKHVMIGWFVLFLVAALTEDLADSHLIWIVLGIVSAACSLGGESNRSSQSHISPLPSTLLPRPVAGVTD